MYYVETSDAAPGFARGAAVGLAGRPQTLANGNRKATGTIVITTNPAADDTVTVNGVTITFKSSGATGNQVNLGGTADLTAAALEAFLTASSNPLLTVATYAVATNTVTVTYKTFGTDGNAFTLATSVPAKITLATATLTTGAAAADISLNTRTTIVTTVTGGNMEFVLPNGFRDDQEKIIFFKTKGGSSNAVVTGTLATYSSGESAATKVTLGAATAFVALRWMNGKWRNMYNAGATYS